MYFQLKKMVEISNILISKRRKTQRLIGRIPKITRIIFAQDRQAQERKCPG